MRLLATCPKGFAPLLITELEVLGALDAKESGAGVFFTADQAAVYRICLWSRLANRILLPLQEARVETPEQLYAAARQVKWESHFSNQHSISVSFTGKSAAINHTHFGALKVKDAVVDYMREKTGERPMVDRDQPDIRLHAHLYRGQLTLSLDLSGESLHRRGYRTQTGAAPLKENLAAALLVRSGWPADFGDEPVLYDPMCGSGTLLIEAAMMAADIAPGLLRASFGFEKWQQHRADIWEDILADARVRKAKGLQQSRVALYGTDQDTRILDTARQGVEIAGVADMVNLRAAALEQMVAPDSRPGLVITNPPYGERLGEESELMFLYRQLGDSLKQDFPRWRAAVFSGNPDLCQAIGLKIERSYRLNNGAIDSRLFLYELYEKSQPQTDAPEMPTGELSQGAQEFANRLRKNVKNLKKWRQQSDIECYRLYDADIPEYAVAVDIYKNQVQVQEYAPPKSVDKVKAFERLKDVLAAVPVVLELDPRQVVLKQRKKQSGLEQYEKRASTGHFFTVQEHGCTLRVNLKDYLDTGLFLDHRPVRRYIQELAEGKDFLNLFCYTATASVHAAVGGAASTTSVDMSATYLQWAMKNMALNGFTDSRHRFIQSDCFSWLKKQRQSAYDLIFMDPPTFSNSKRMQDVLDVQRDHVMLIKSAMRLLNPGGLLIFSNNYRRFKLDYELLAGFDIKEITPQTIDPDFRRNNKIHSCFEIRRLS